MLLVFVVYLTLLLDSLPTLPRSQIIDGTKTMVVVRTSASDVIGFLERLSRLLRLVH